MLAALIDRQVGSRAEVARALQVGRSTVSAWLNCKQGIAPDDLAQLVTVLGTTLDAVRAAAEQLPDRNPPPSSAQPVDTHDTPPPRYPSRTAGVLEGGERPVDDVPADGARGTPSVPGTAGPGKSDAPAGGTAGVSATGAASAGGTEVRSGGRQAVEAVEVVAYPEFELWDRVDPRVMEDRRRALAPGRRRLVVVGEVTEKLGPPETAMAIRVKDDRSLRHLQTALGAVQAGWLLWVDLRGTEKAVPGMVVAALARGQLVVGSLHETSVGGWEVQATPELRLAVRSEDICGPVVHVEGPTPSSDYIFEQAPDDDTDGRGHDLSSGVRFLHDRPPLRPATSP